jgi:hypothetical protein
MLQSSEVTQSWEVAKGVMATLSTAGILWACKTLFKVRDDVRDLKYDVSGKDGDNGIKSLVKNLDKRVEVLEDHKIMLDAVEDAERAQYQGDERRHGARRLRDIIRDEHTGDR